MALSLIAFDTDHIKRYVFGTDKLKEIRGASSLLDYLNRIGMRQLARDYQAQEVYANGGSGLFYLDKEKVEKFGKHVQRSYHKATGGGSSITFASVPLPEGIKKIDDEDIHDIFELLQWRLQEAKQHPPAFLGLTSHPFMRLCDACGIEYAAAADPSKEIKIVRAPNEGDEQYCISCRHKRARDTQVKELIDRELIQDRQPRNAIPDKDYLWSTIIERLGAMEYTLPAQTERPGDFNVFRNFKGAKDYLALIYADANNMGRTISKRCSISARRAFATTVDEAIYTAVCTAITRHLKIADHLKAREQLNEDLKNPVFPFDILLMGGDDICMVVPASVAMDVALTIAKTFHSETHEECTLSVGVVLSPIKYPFSLLQEMAETSLKFAKKAGADARTQANKTGSMVDDSRINFMIVTGGSSSNFTSVYNAVYHRNHKGTGGSQDFHATLRPYAPDDLAILLRAIRAKEGANLGRTKLHQLREAIFKMNLTTSVGDSLAVLRNWHPQQRDHVLRQVYEFAGQHQMLRNDPRDPLSGFPQVTFPWFADGKNEKNGDEIFRTSLLDFIELYDFLAREDGDTSDEN